MTRSAKSVGATHRSRPSRRRGRAAIVAVCAIALAAGGCSKSTDDDTSAILLEAASSSGVSPWTESVANTTGATERANQISMSSTTVTGDEAGLYGGSLNDSVCDQVKLSNFLESNPAKDSAFKSVVQADDVRSYVDALSPVVLTHDTRVTDHGFENNEAAPFQSVLQTGTAVMIDDRGLPRVRCASGSPLTPPIETNAGYTGQRWNNFAENQVVTVDPAPAPMSSTELTSLDGSATATKIVIGDPAPLEAVPPTTSRPPTLGGTPTTGPEPGAGQPSGSGENGGKPAPPSGKPIPKPGVTSGGESTGGGGVTTGGGEVTTGGGEVTTGGGEVTTGGGEVTTGGGGVTTGGGGVTTGGGEVTDGGGVPTGGGTANRIGPSTAEKPSGVIVPETATPPTE